MRPYTLLLCRACLLSPSSYSQAHANSEDSVATEPEVAAATASTAESIDAALEPTVIAPNFTLSGPGGLFSLSEHEGRVVVLNFWATWNELSQQGMAALERLDRDVDDEDVVVAGIAVDDDAPEALRAWADSLRLPQYLLLADSSGATARAYGDIELLPTTIIVDREGFISVRHTGILTYDELLDLLGPVLIGDHEPPL